MKVLIINVDCGVGSTGRICTDMAAEFEKNGDEVKIAWGRDNLPVLEQRYGIRIGNKSDVYKNVVKARLFDNEGFNAKKQTLQFLEKAEEYNPDILWLHNLHGYYLNVEMLFNWIKKRPKMKVKWLLHDCWAFTGHCSYFALVRCEQWKAKCSHCSQSREYPKSIFKDNSLFNFERKQKSFTGVSNMIVVTPSRWLAELVKESFLKEYPVEIRHNTIDLNVFKPTPSDFRKRYGLEDRKIILGVANVWDERKGLNDFKRLAEMLDNSYAIVLVGLTEKQKKDIPNTIVCILRTNSKKELAEIYTAADIFFNPTYEDNYPTVNLESQACGTPCITYRTGGSPESVPPDNVVEQGDLSKAINRFRALLP